MSDDIEDKLAAALQPQEVDIDRKLRILAGMEISDDLKESIARFTKLAEETSLKLNANVGPSPVERIAPTSFHLIAADNFIAAQSLVVDPANGGVDFGGAPIQVAAIVGAMSQLSWIVDEQIAGELVEQKKRILDAIKNLSCSFDVYFHSADIPKLAYNPGAARYYRVMNRPVRKPKRRRR